MEVGIDERLALLATLTRPVNAERGGQEDAAATSGRKRLLRPVYARPSLDVSIRLSSSLLTSAGVARESPACQLSIRTVEVYGGGTWTQNRGSRRRDGERSW